MTAKTDPDKCPECGGKFRPGALDGTRCCYEGHVSPLPKRKQKSAGSSGSNDDWISGYIAQQTAIDMMDL